MVYNIAFFIGCVCFQDDLSDFLATYSLKVPVIKKLVPEADTDTRRKLLNNFLKVVTVAYCRIEKYTSIHRNLVSKVSQKFS